MKKFTKLPSSAGQSIKAAWDYDESPDTLAEKIAEDLSTFLDMTSRMENIEEILSAEELEQLGDTMDMLHFFREYYAQNKDSHKVLPK